MTGYNQILLRSSALAGVAAALIGAPEANAITLNSVSVTGATSLLTECYVTATISVLGNVNDGLNRDFYAVGGYTASGIRYNAPLVRNVSVGQTSNVAVDVPISVGNASRTDYVYNVFELTNQVPPPGNAVPLSSTPIPRSILLAAGGNCAQIAPNFMPVANAGPDGSATPSALYSLTGGGSDADNDPLSYVWTQVSGPNVVLSSTTTLSPTFTAPAQLNRPQTLIFELVANDGLENSIPDTVEITIPAGPNTLPVADAGTDATVSAGATVSLAGSGTDFDSDPLTFQWSQVSGPSVTITNPGSAAASFVAPASTGAIQTLSFELVANDGAGDSAPDTVVFTIPANSPPSVNAGSDATVVGASLVNLEGTATDPENDPLTYQWTQVSGPPIVLANDTTLLPSFTSPAKTNSVQTLSFDLVANDGTSNSSADSVEITVQANIGPTTDAGADISTSGGALVTLVGTASADGDGDTLSYAWTQTSGPLVTLSDAAAATPTFTAPISGLSVQTLTFELVVSDGVITGAADQVSVLVGANSPPSADAGSDQGPFDGGQTVTLSGAGSSDPDNNTLTYRWTQVSGTPVVLSDPAAASPTFAVPLVLADEDLVFELVVNDGAVDSLPDAVIVSVRSVGSVRIIHRVIGRDASISFTSDIASLTGSVTSQNGTSELLANSVPSGAHTISASDLSALGYALTGISCSDTDSVVNLANRSISLSLSPGETLTCTFISTDTRSAAEVAIESFLTGRNALLLANQPDAGRRIGRLMNSDPGAGQVSVAGFGVPGASVLPLSLAIGQNSGSFSTSLSRLHAAAGGADPSRPALPLDFWTEVNFGTVKFDNQKQDYQLVYLGADYLIQPDLLVGLMGAFDNVGRRGGYSAGTAEGSGWMAGPYATTRLAPNLFADIRASWGGSDNTVSPLGTFTDDFSTNRALYSASLSGVFELDAATQIRPEMSVRYIAEDQKTYRDRYGVTIPGRTVDQGELAFSPRIDRTFELRSGWTVQPYLSADGIYSFGTGDASGVLDSLRARIELGAGVYKRGSLRVNFSATQDGIGSSGYQSTGAIISLSRAF